MNIHARAVNHGMNINSKLVGENRNMAKWTAYTWPYRIRIRN